MPRLLDPRIWFRLPDNFIGEAWGLKKANAVRVFNPPAEVRKAWEDEIANCPSCISKSPVSHGTTVFYDDGSMYTYKCRSFSRHIDPRTGEMDGYSHCTCDGCF